MADNKITVDFLNQQIKLAVEGSNIKELRSVMGELLGYRVTLYMVKPQSDGDKSCGFEVYDIAANMVPKVGELPESFSFSFMDTKGFDVSILEGIPSVTATKVEGDDGSVYFRTDDEVDAVVVELGRKEDIIYALQYLMVRRKVESLGPEGYKIKPKA